MVKPPPPPMFAKLKDAASSAAAKSFLQSKLGAAGDIQELTIDSRAKKVSLTVLLAGESSPVSVEVGGYTIHQESEGAFIEIQSVQSSRRWVEMLCSAHLYQRKIEIPRMVATLL